LVEFKPKGQGQGLTTLLMNECTSIRLDYCNSLLYGIGDGLVKKLQCRPTGVCFVCLLMFVVFSLDYFSNYISSFEPFFGDGNTVSLL